MKPFQSLLKREFALLTRFNSYEYVVVRTSNYIHWYNTNRISIKV
ncbi:IS3 family transposase [Nicoliella spurrieriana]